MIVTDKELCCLSTGHLVQSHQSDNKIAVLSRLSCLTGAAEEMK